MSPDLDARIHPSHDLYPAQLLPPQSRSPQSPFLLLEGTLKENILMWLQGDIFNVVQPSAGYLLKKSMWRD